MPVRIKVSQVAAVRAAIAKKQNYCCALCGESVRSTARLTPALDHDHQTGFIRGVLCLNCNGMEGKVFNLARRAKKKLTEKQWLERLIAYYTQHATPQHGGVLHHTHKTEEEKRVARNTKARNRRAAAKRAAK